MRTFYLLASSVNVQSSTCCSLAVNSSRPQIRTGTPGVFRIHRRTGNLCSQFWLNQLFLAASKYIYDVGDHNRFLCIHTQIHTHTHTCTRVLTYIYTHTQSANPSARRKRDYGLYVHIHKHLNTYTRIDTRVCVCVCVSIYSKRAAYRNFSA